MNGLDRYLSEATSQAESSRAATGSFLDELRQDMTNGHGELVSTTAALAGFAARAALARSPVATAALSGLGALVLSGVELARGGKDMTTVSEGLIGLGLGASGATRAVAASPTLESFAFKVTRRAEYATRALMPDNLWFKLPGSAKLGEDIVSAENRVNLDALVATYAPDWNGVERARVFDIATRRASIELPGTPNGVYVGLAEAKNAVFLHTHPPGNGHPSFEDFIINNGLNAVDNAESTTVFYGQRAQWFDALNHSRPALAEQSAGNDADLQAAADTLLPMSPRMLVLDKVARTAVVQQSTWSHALGAWQNDTTTAVDYQAARRAIRAVDPQDRTMNFLSELTRNHALPDADYK